MKFYKNLSNFYDETNIRNFKFEEDLFSKNAPGISKIYHEVLLSMKFSQTKPPIKKMKNIYCDLYYTVIKNRDDKKIVNDEYENIENDFFKYEDFIIPNHNKSIKPREAILK